MGWFRVDTRMSKDEVYFSEQLELAQLGKGSDHMDSTTGLAFAEYGLTKGFGVQIMEGYGIGDSKGKHGTYHQILGVDEDGENWADHKDPIRALDLVRVKLGYARKENLEMRYKFWMCL